MSRFRLQFEVQCSNRIQLAGGRLLTVLLLGACGAGVLAAEPSAIERAYARTKTASSVEDYTQVIELCTAANKENLSAGEQRYVRRLLSWAYNRRGEARTEKAARLMNGGEREAAAQLDAQALEDFEAAVEQDPTRWKALHNRGVSNALAGNYERAIADFSRVIELNKSYANAWFNRGEIHYEQGDFTAALRDYNRAIQLNDRDAGAYTSRGHTYFRLRRYAVSLNDYQRAVQLDPSAETFANRGDAYQSLGEWEQAASDFRRAIELDSKSARAYQSAAWFMATCPDERYRNRRALEAAKRAVDLNADEDHRFLDTLAAAFANAGQFDQAVSTLSRAIELAPQTELPALRQRLNLYQNQKPYRQDRAPTANVSTEPGAE